MKMHLDERTKEANNEQFYGRQQESYDASGKQQFGDYCDLFGIDRTLQRLPQR